MATKVRLLLFTDHPIVRQGVLDALRDYDEVEIVDEAESLADALRKIQDLAPDAILIDPFSLAVSVAEAEELLQDLAPSVRVMRIGGDRGPGAGPRQDHGPECDARQAPRYDPHWKLTAAEETVLTLLTEGYSNKAIASTLNLSINTVKTHVRRVLQKLRVNTRQAATRMAVSYSVIPRD